MPLNQFNSILAFLLVGTALLAQGKSPVPSRRQLPYYTSGHAKSGHDRADLRRDWDWHWFGGEATPEYLDAKGALARREVERWGHLLPGGRKAFLAAGVATESWVNLGPTGNLTTSVYSHDSGRLVAIVTHPTDPATLYVATSGGGVFKCTNADLSASSDWTWTPITDSLPESSSSGNVSVGALAMSRVDPNTLYLGCGDAFDARGRGFFRSTNGGATWTQATGLGSASRTYSILGINASTVFVGTNDGLKKSQDGGVTFLPVALGGISTGQVRSIRALTSTDFICSQNEIGSGGDNFHKNGKIFYSSDGGSTWNQATTAGLTATGWITLEVSLSSGSKAWGIAEDSSSQTFQKGLLSSADKGHSWTFVAAPTISGGLFQGIGRQMSSDGSQGWYNHGLAVDPTNVNRVFVGANLALYRTEDGGANWTQFTHWFADKHVYAHADFHTAAWAASGGTLYFGNDGGLAIVRNPAIPSASVPTGAGLVPSDVTFIDNRRNKGLTSHLVYNLGSTTAATPANSRYRISLGLQDNGTRVRQDMGAGLSASGIFEDGIGGDGFGTVIHPLDGNKILGSLYYTAIYRSTNGGSNFSESISGITEANSDTDAPFAPKLALGRADATGNTVYTATNDVVYKSTDFGADWTAMAMTGYDPSSYIIRNFNASTTDPQAVAIVTREEIGKASNASGFVTYNGGSTWSQFGSLPNNSGGRMSYVWFNTSTASTLYAASVSLSQTATHLWKSGNSGATWTSLEGTGFPTGIPVHVIQNEPNDPNHLFVGTDFGVYHSTDGGTTWARYGSGLPLVAVRDLYIAPDSSFIRVATFGRGVWELQPNATAVAPTITSQPQNQAVASGQTATFSVVAAGTAPLTYQWRKNGTAIALNGTSSSYTTPTLTVVDSGSAYMVTVYNSAGATDSNPATLTVTAAPTPPGISAHPQNFTTGLVGGEATFSVTATGTGPFTYAWTKNGSAVGTNSATLTLTGLVIGDSGQKIRVTVSNSGGSTLSNEATLTVRTRDLSGDTTVDVLDLAYFSRVYGTSDAAADLNGDGTVNDADLDLLLAGL